MSIQPKFVAMRIISRCCLHAESVGEVARSCSSSRIERPAGGWYSPMVLVSIPRHDPGLRDGNMHGLRPALQGAGPLET